MSNIREYVGCKSIEAVNYDGKGNDLCNMWLTDEEIVRCRDCRHFKESFMRCKKHFTELYANDGKALEWLNCQLSLTTSARRVSRHDQCNKDS